MSNLEQLEAELDKVRVEKNAQYWRFTRGTGKNDKPVDPALCRQEYELERQIQHLKLLPLDPELTLEQVKEAHSVIQMGTSSRRVTPQMLESYERVKALYEKQAKEKK